jgi:phage shock protein A
MSLLQRVTTLIRANLNDLIDKAEDPEKMLKQLLLDLQNQFVQVKTQVAIAIADQHLLEKKRAESLELQQQNIRRAQLALAKGDEALARTALAQSLSHEAAAANYAQQRQDQEEEVRLLRDALHRLEAKIAETRARAEVLVMQHRRARSGQRAGNGFAPENVLERAESRVVAATANHRATMLLDTETTTSKLEALDRDERVDRLLADLKAQTLAISAPEEQAPR